MVFDGRGPLLDFGGQPQNSPFATLLGQLDSEINTMSEALKAFDFQTQERVQLPQLPMPNMTQGLGAILQNIVDPGAAERFVQGVQQVQRANAEISIQQAQFDRDSARNELAKRYGVDFVQFQEMLQLRSELRREAMKAQLGLGGKSEVQIRAQWNAIKDQLKGTEGRNVISTILADPEQRAVAAMFVGGDPNDVASLRVGLESIAGEGEFGREVTAERLGQGRERLDISRENLQLNLSKYQSAEQVDLLEANESVGKLVGDVAQLDASIEELKSKLEDQGDLDKPVKLKTKIEGKERYTLRELMQLRRAATNIMAGYVTAYPQLAERHGLQYLLNTPSLNIRGNQPVVPQTAPQGDERQRALDLLRGGM